MLGLCRACDVFRCWIADRGKGKVNFMRMIDCATDDEWDVDLEELAQGDVFYDEGGTYMRSQTVNGHPLIVSDMGLMCTIEEIEHAFEANGRIPKLVRCQGVWGHVGF